jgi:hypothetical protein
MRWRKKMKSKLTFEIIEFEDGDIQLRPKITGTLTIQAIVLIILTLFETLRTFMGWHKAIWLVIKQKINGIRIGEE